MIFTECTNTECNEPIALPWEPSDGGSYYRHACGECGEVSFIECTTMPGETLSEEEFWKMHPEAKKQEA
jgi:hypothetical protein